MTKLEKRSELNFEIGVKVISFGKKRNKCLGRESIVRIVGHWN